ncbi:MAG: 30S ribosomal protein S20 [Rhodothermales bacterium]
MPQHKSAEKRVRQSETRRLRNRNQRSKIRTLIKSLEDEKDKEKATALLSEAKASLDRLAGKNIIHKNNAANQKSALEKYVNSLS